MISTIVLIIIIIIIMITIMILIQVHLATSSRGKERLQRPQFSKSFVGWLEPGHNHDDGGDDDDDDGGKMMVVMLMVIFRAAFRSSAGLNLQITNIVQHF